MPAKLFDDDAVEFPPNQRPIFPGSPARPVHPTSRRVAYAIVGTILGITSGFGNALVLTNTTYLLGALGADATEAAWIPTVYVMTFITMNLVAVKFRQQFGLRFFTMCGLMLFCVVTAVHLFAVNLVGALYIHALAGIASAPLLTLTVYYYSSALPPKKALNAAVLGLAVTQISTPLARLFPGDDFIHDQWLTLYCFELGLGLLCLAAVGFVRLPPSERTKAFELLDLISYPLIAGGMALLTAVIGLGRYEWWLDRDWLGWCLAAAIPMLAMAMLFESCRAKPLLQIGWLGSEGLFRFVIVIFALRFVLSQQQIVAFGLLTNAGVLSTSVRLFSVVLVCSAIAGCLTAAIFVTEKNILFIASVAFAIVSGAALMESFSTNLTRTPELLVPEALISFATTLGVGPSIGVGLGKVLKTGAKYLTSFLVILSIAQNFGGLVGSTMLGTYQVVREKADSVALVERAPAFDPLVQARVASQGGGVAGVAVLEKAMTSEANVLAYNNASTLVAIIAFLTSLYLIGRGLFERRFARLAAV